MLIYFLQMNLKTHESKRFGSRTLIRNTHFVVCIVFMTAITEPDPEPELHWRLMFKNFRPLRSSSLTLAIKSQISVNHSLPLLFSFVQSDSRKFTRFSLCYRRREVRFLDPEIWTRSDRTGRDEDTLFQCDISIKTRLLSEYFQ